MYRRCTTCATMTTARFLKLRPSPSSGAPALVHKALVRDLDGADYPDKLIVPYGEIVHNRIMLEIFRGCIARLPLLSGGHDLPPGARAAAWTRLMAAGRTSWWRTPATMRFRSCSLSSGDYSLPAGAGDTSWWTISPEGA